MMGVDYDGVGGIGIKFTDEMEEKAVSIGLFTQEEWDEDPHCCMEKVGVPFSPAGNAYSGNELFYLLVEGETLNEINENATEFVKSVEKLSPGITVDDLKVISDGHIW